MESLSNSSCRPRNSGLRGLANSWCGVIPEGSLQSKYTLPDRNRIRSLSTAIGLDKKPPTRSKLIRTRKLRRSVFQGDSLPGAIRPGPRPNFSGFACFQIYEFIALGAVENFFADEKSRFQSFPFGD